MSRGGYAGAASSSTSRRERVACAVCGKLVRKSAAAMVQLKDRVAFFCSMDCYEKWQLRAER